MSPGVGRDEALTNVQDEPARARVIAEAFAGLPRESAAS